jgi:hypothetical protein
VGPRAGLEDMEKIKLLILLRLELQPLGSPAHVAITVAAQSRTCMCARHWDPEFESHSRKSYSFAYFIYVYIYIYVCVCVCCPV